MQEDVREETFLIVGVSAVISDEEEGYDTIAVVINEDSEIEAINIEGFEVGEDVTSLIGSFLHYKEDENDEYEGKILKKA